MAIYNAETNKDFDLKFTRNPISNDVLIKTDRPDTNRFPALEQSITNILMTNKFERRFSPKFGGDIQTSLFELMSDFEEISVPGEINIRETIKIALKNYEPRIRVNNISFGTKDEWMMGMNDNKLNITINYSIPPVNEVLTYTLGIKRVK
tara:strand:- start:1199 stop:1648 length:450 start_codon:yes stop_codon:yes gene_type:complete